MGFVPKPRTREVICDWLDPEEGSDPLTATIKANLTFAEIDAMAEMFKPTTTFSEVFEVVAPNVIAWNAMALDLVSGEYVAVPPPAEGGIDSLRAVDPSVSQWLLLQLRMSYLGGPEREEKSKGSDDTAEPSAA